MFEVKPRAVEKKESSTETDEGLGSTGKHYGSGSLGSGSAGSGSVYLSDSQDWVVSPSCSPDEGSNQHNAISPMLAEETFRYMRRGREREGETLSKRNPAIQPVLSVAEFKARARVTGQRERERRGSRVDS